MIAGNPAMDVLCFDIGSGGITAARFDENLHLAGSGEVAWQLQRDAAGKAALSADTVEFAFKRAAQPLLGNRPAAVSIACFMHSFLLTDLSGAPQTPVFTWMDITGNEGVNRVRQSVGDAFHERTGCHYHPMFPVFKLASMNSITGTRVLSPKAMLVDALTGLRVEDYGMAAASGLLNAHSADWDATILAAAGIDPEELATLRNPTDIAGPVTALGAARFGIPKGTPVVIGSGDGFLANIGSGCERPRRMAITLGTSASVRRMIASPSLDAKAGTFCYRATKDAYLLGCASSNGGNAIDWAKGVFGSVPSAVVSTPSFPIFLPWLNGERSIEWDPELRAMWHGIGTEHKAADLMRAVVEGVAFNLAQYAEIVERLSGSRAEEFVLSGNGFLEPIAAPLIAALVKAPTLEPEAPGLASLRGAALYAWRALGHDATPALERLLARSAPVRSVADAALMDRFAKFKELRRASAPA